MKPLCIFIVGPTASGKTDIAFKLAQHFNTEIISADSRQCFCELNIGVAKPPLEYLKTIPHHFINSHSITEDISTAIFKTYAEQKIKQLSQKYKIIIIVGGTGFYIDALLYGLNDIPAIPFVIRQQINEQVANKGLTWLQDEVKKQDPVFYAHTDINNKYRLQRALEVFKTTGISITQYKKNKTQPEYFDYKIIGLQTNRQQLYDIINMRVEGMIKNGLKNEVEELFKQNLLQKPTIGYTEFINYFNHTNTLNETIEQIKTHTRNYAKRQITWFKRNTEITFFAKDDLEAMITYVKK